MRTKPESSWIVLSADGWHNSLGRTEPSEGEVLTTSNALSVQGLCGWVAGIDGDR